MRKSFLRGVALVCGIVLTVQSGMAVPDQSDKRNRNQGPAVIRDAEIEGLLRIYSGPIFKAAGINSKAAKVVVIGDPSINAFVAGGQRIFVNAGLITRAPNPNTVIGVLAHESGHIAGGHLAKMNSAMAEASTNAIIGTIFGIAAMVGGAMAGSTTAARAGQGVIMGSQGAAQRSFLVYARAMESTADESAMRYLEATHQSAKGMLDLFRVLANESLASTTGADPYAYSHPMPFDRIRTLEATAQASQWYNRQDDAALMLRHKLAQAKLIGFLQPQQVFQKYPSSDNSLPARYARAIAFFRRGDLASAIPVIDSLTAEVPQDPYFWELKAQAYLENGKAAQGLPFIQKARAILPNNGLLQILNAQILLGTENPAMADQAITLLKQARMSEGQEPSIYKFMAQAYGAKNDIARAELATAEYAYATGDAKLAGEKAAVAMKYLKKGTPEWLRASDIASFSAKK
ncbi:M48 family metalloprotease [Aestuariivirga litoralis]|uniref:M48 family metalloprotease n=1 Tax=Aestuariivirga litoralis TaxID=2650924 RepID=UPI0018C680A0|nr:M48 family metalloprotease [Aestuariivirga litoralis]